MAQPDPAIIARAFTDLGAQIPLISNHPTVQMLGQVQNFQEEIREQFRQHNQQLTRLQRTIGEMRQEFRIGMDEMGQEFRISLGQVSREFVPSHTYYYWYWWTYQKYSQALLPLRLYNTSIGNKAHLRYPDGVQAQAITRDELLTFTGNTILHLCELNSRITAIVLQCQQLAVALGLPALLPNVAVQDRRQKIALYLGVSI